MNARIRLAASLMAGLAIATTATAQIVPAIAVSPAGRFVEIALTSPEPAAEPRVRAADYTRPCAASTFSELGHGHADVADAGYASVHCPNYDARAEAAVTE